MFSKRQDAKKSRISPVLFMAVDGQPMSFYLRPSPVKQKVQPLIVAGGGVVSGVQEPQSILLIDPLEESCVPASSTHWYVSTQYIHDCIEKNEQLDIESYRLNPGSSHVLNIKRTCQATRLPYTAEEDAAILSYVKKSKAEIGGNRMWQEMEKERVTNHSWQSMKYRYKARLTNQQSEVVEKTTAEEGNEAENTIDAPSTAAEDMLVEMPVCPQEEREAADRQTAQQPVKNPEETLEADSFDSPQHPPAPSEITDPPIAVSTQKEPRPEDSSSVQPDPHLEAKEKLRTFPASAPPQRRSTRSHPQLSLSPQQYSRKLRSSANSEEWPSPSLLRSKKTKAAAQVDLKEDRVEEPPSKKARGKRLSESQNTELSPSAASETEPASQKKKSKQKRNLGILEMATKEFEDGSDQSGEDEVADNLTEREMKNPTETEPRLLTEDAAASPQSTPEDEAADNPTETEMKNPTETEPRLLTEDAAASPQSTPTPEPDPEESAQEVQATSNDCQPAGGTVETIDVNSKAHLFIFDSESQEEEGSQVTSGDGLAPVLANLQPTAKAISTFSLTQAQLEEDKRRVTKLMSDTKRDLVSVTKALLKTSGDFSEARLLLLDSLGSGQLWHCYDDNLLMSGDAAVQEQLQEKYGEERMTKRIVFLELQA